MGEKHIEYGYIIPNQISIPIGFTDFMVRLMKMTLDFITRKCRFIQQKRAIDIYKPIILA